MIKHPGPRDPKLYNCQLLLGNMQEYAHCIMLVESCYLYSLLLDSLRNRFYY